MLISVVGTTDQQIVLGASKMVMNLMLVVRAVFPDMEGRGTLWPQNPIGSVLVFALEID